MNNLVTWNIKGLNGLNKQRDLRTFGWKNKIGLAGLMETAVKSYNFGKVANSFNGWQHSVNYNAHEGRIA